LTVAERERKERICRIQELLNQGYPASSVKDLLGITYNTIRRYKDGDPDLLCRFPEKQGAYNPLERYKEFIIDCLNKKMTLAAILEEIHKTDISVKRTAFNGYCNKLKVEYGINNKVNSVGKVLNPEPIKARYIKRKDVLRFLWTGKVLSQEDITVVCNKYDVVHHLECFMFDFKSVFKEKSKIMLTGFIEIYKDSEYSKIKSFINGLLMDLDAVENAVELPYSNGYIEGNNNRLKMIKRMMYGREKLPLLETRILYGDQIFLSKHTHI
jgi:hypothetical protein